MNIYLKLAKIYIIANFSPGYLTLIFQNAIIIVRSLTNSIDYITNVDVVKIIQAS